MFLALLNTVEEFVSLNPYDITMPLIWQTFQIGTLPTLPNHGFRLNKALLTFDGLPWIPVQITPDLNHHLLNNPTCMVPCKLFLSTMIYLIQAPLSPILGFSAFIPGNIDIKFINFVCLGIFCISHFAAECKFYPNHLLEMAVTFSPGRLANAPILSFFMLSTFSFPPIS